MGKHRLLGIACATAAVSLIAVLWSIESGAPASSRMEESPNSANAIWQIHPADDARTAAPGGSGLDRLPPEKIHRLEPLGRVPEPDQPIRLDLGERRELALTVGTSLTHPNGDISVHAAGDGKLPPKATLTWGSDGVYGRIRTADGLFLVHSDATGTWLLDLDDERISVDDFGNDTLGAIADDIATASQRDRQTQPESDGTENGQSVDQIDVMFVYTPEMTERYPGELIETRLNHLVAIANQTMVDSRVPVVVRLVHHQPVSYEREQENAAALRDLARAMHGEYVPGLEGVLQERIRNGADIVSLTWPHDIETRGSCGMAFFPRTDERGDPDPRFGVHIANDGASNWSVCSDAVFTHELGHNLGAEHQRGAASSDDPRAYHYGFVRHGRFHTVMATFPTGHTHRYLRLEAFSNPDIVCGGEPCGSMEPRRAANNARRITELAPVVADYLTSRHEDTAQRPDPSEPDSDNDGVSDWEDPYPFDPFDGDKPPVTTPPLVFNERTIVEPKSEHDFELLVVSSGNDRVLSYGPDGRFRGVVAAPEAVDAGPVLTEFSDLDIDRQGMLYLLASGDVRRFDRLSGRLIDVFLSSQLPRPRELQSSFPRAMGWAGDEQLIVLGDDAIERYDQAGNRLNARHNPDQPQTNPDSWDAVVDLPLRAFAERNERLYVAEAALGRIMVFDTRNGRRETDVAGMNNPHITDPRDLAFGPDGLLYVANGRDGNVLRFDTERRVFVDEFITAGSGALEFVRALAFGPQGDLYVASRSDHRILRFDGTSGEFLETVVPAGHGGLEHPENLQFVPVLDEIHVGHSGHYFVPERSGEGWLLEILDDDQAVLSWFTYPPDDYPLADQAWVLGIGRIEGRRIVFDDLKSTRLFEPARGLEADNVELIDWGRMELSFSNCDHGRLSFDSNVFAESGEMDFIRLAGIAGLPCGSLPLAPSAAAPGITGQWYDPSRNGQGWFFQETAPGRIFTAWFTYDEAGEQAWIVGEGDIDGDIAKFDELIITRGARFGQDFDPDAVERNEWGSMTVRFFDCYSAEIEYQSSRPGFGDGGMQADRLTEPGDLDCDLPVQ